MGALGGPWGPGLRAEAARARLNASVHTTHPQQGPHIAEDLVRKRQEVQALTEVGRLRI